MDKYIKLVVEIETGLTKPKTIWNKFYIASEDMFTEWGWNKQAIADIITTPLYGYNWGRLHPTGGELVQTKEDALACFHSELLYCSDRMSLHRFMRVQWLLMLYLEKTGKKEKIADKYLGIK